MLATIKIQDHCFQEEQQANGPHRLSKQQKPFNCNPTDEISALFMHPFKS